jgi:ABC-2 type transport system permease protein
VNVKPVLAHDLRGATTSRGAWALAVLFAVVFGGTAYALSRAGADFGAYLDVLASVAGFFFPLVGVMLGYRAVADDRESGRLALLLSLPPSRADAIAGTLLGRAAALTGPFAVGALAGGAVAAVLLSGFDALRYGGFALAALAYCLAMLAVAGGVSAAAATSRRAALGGFGAYLLAASLWGQLVDALLLVLFRFRGEILRSPPLWAESLTFLNPRLAFRSFVGATFDAGTVPAIVESQWFAPPAVGVLVLLGWIALAPLAGYLSFRRAEL